MRGTALMSKTSLTGRHRFCCGLLLIVVGSACSSRPTPEQQLATLEAELLNSPTLTVSFEVIATGAFAAELRGTLTIMDDDQTSLRADGSFGGEPVSLHLDSTDTGLVGGNGDNQFAVAQPAALREALIIGLTRMGILHNLARLTSVQLPDHADGGVQNWVQADSLTGGGDSLSFSIIVAGQTSGEATLLFSDPQTLLGREQVVNFPGGSMQVTESYTITSSGTGISSVSLISSMTM